MTNKVPETLSAKEMLSKFREYKAEGGSSLEGQDSLLGFGQSIERVLMDVSVQSNNQSAEYVFGSLIAMRSMMWLGEDNSKEDVREFMSALREELEIENYNDLEILSNYQMFKSPRQQEALQTNPYLQGFGEWIDKYLGGDNAPDLSEKVSNKDYAAGRMDAIHSMMNLSQSHSKEEIDKLMKDLKRLKEFRDFNRERSRNKRP